MPDKNLAPVYDPANVEDRLYQKWLDNNNFQAPGDPDKEPFTIVIPPPNVTGTLHMGHALDNTIQDILIRRKRMQDFDTLWLPGTDHAGIATQIKVEEHLAADGVSRYDLGREAFLDKVWDWKEEYHARIIRQLQKLGVSCDWSRERFTMDEGCSHAVREVFVTLYERGLIYRGDYIINWCPRCLTALSDIEVEHEDQEGALTFIRYPLTDSDEHLVVATTRPETMLGDTAVAVHPQDSRYQHLIGKTVMLPLMNRPIPVIADDYVDPEFGSGAVKITPAHDPNDFAMAERHNIPSVVVIGNDGTMTEEAGKYSGLDRYEARKQVVADLKEAGVLLKAEDHTHAVGHCQRCSTVIEPLLSKQWFVRMKPLAKPAIERVKNGDIRFVPERFTKVYLNWVENIRDWCISRQIWWGHRIPAWYCDCGETIVSREEPQSCKQCGSSSLVQDDDVLDTWFSSALWPFSTLGWPDETKDLKHFYPTDVLVTGYDIIYFWVARMIFMGLEFMEEIPFHTVYIHGLVRDAQGRKMSKSLGNGVDPLQIIDEYGADTLRFTLITGQGPGNDQRFRQESVENSRNFANKIWNASRFVLMNLDDFTVDQVDLSSGLTDADRWILHRYNKTVREVNRLMDAYELGEAARTIYEFLWSDFCDWYIEMAKIPLYNAESEAEKNAVRSVLTYVLDRTLRLLHPFMPFITEEIWQKLPHEGETIVLALFPEYDDSLDFARAHANMDVVMEVTRTVRYLRSEVQLPPAKKAKVILHTGSDAAAAALKDGTSMLQKLASLDEVEIVSTLAEKPKQALTAVVGDTDIYLPLVGLVDLEQELARLKKELKKLDAELKRSAGKLSNQGFLAKAPEEVVAEERAKAEDYQLKRDKVAERIRSLE
ncbi:valine--tRNA ligase [Dethiobacter alkaliphilus]|uniref:Valine--tRNA ligase n=1 Tax=Dethiobacter alkaliphilus AHT 1 TaxID=555088 RepID=C0GEY7_DETAL|nr:valine--tRNA ligase [Dethiobacter alkaliphilus]EEG78169.1 valyl-tRNA synthetase [Dethiobacter alkaliphilus AHT 1]